MSKNQEYLLISGRAVQKVSMIRPASIVGSCDLTWFRMRLMHEHVASQCDGRNGSQIVKLVCSETVEENTVSCLIFMAFPSHTTIHSPVFALTRVEN